MPPGGGRACMVRSIQSAARTDHRPGSTRPAAYPPTRLTRRHPPRVRACSLTYPDAFSAGTGFARPGSRGMIRRYWRLPGAAGLTAIQPRSAGLMEAGRLSGPRGVRGQRGAGRVRPGSIVAVTRNRPTRQTPAGAGVRAGLRCCCHPARGWGRQPCMHGPGWFVNRDAKITPACRRE
jgi:hypothetical protein